MPNDLSLWSRRSWGTVLNAFDKSKYMTSMLDLRSNMAFMLVRAVINWVRVDLPFMKPCCSIVIFGVRRGI